MSIEIMAAIWDRGPTEQSERFVMLALADFANDEGECWPSVSTIKDKVCMSERGVQAVLRRLEASGWIAVEAGGGRRNCNLYRLKTPQQVHPAADAPPQMDAETPQMDVLNPAAGAPKPFRTINEPSTTTARASARDIEPSGKHVVARVVRSEKTSGHVPPDVQEHWTGIQSILGCDGPIKPDGKLMSSTNDQFEIQRWDAMGITREAQVCVIQDQLAKAHKKNPDFIPNSYRWLTAGMDQYAAAKARGTAAPLANASWSERRAAAKANASAERRQKWKTA